MGCPLLSCPPVFHLPPWFRSGQPSGILKLEGVELRVSRDEAEWLLERVAIATVGGQVVEREAASGVMLGLMKLRMQRRRAAK